jgi:hypothetical protein
MNRDASEPTPLFYPGLERLIVAAATKPEIADLLIRDPAAALDQIKEALQLSPEEYSLALSITGSQDIIDYVSRLHASVQRRRGVYNG